MENILGQSMKNLREKKFPGSSLRRVGEEVFEKKGLGKFFYTQINKMETGTIVPSIELLTKILGVYEATSSEKADLMENFLVQSMLGTEKDLGMKEPSIQKALALYRKIKKTP